MPSPDPNQPRLRTEGRPRRPEHSESPGSASLKIHYLHLQMAEEIDGRPDGERSCSPVHGSTWKVAGHCERGPHLPRCSQILPRDSPHRRDATRAVLQGGRYVELPQLHALAARIVRAAAVHHRPRPALRQPPAWHRDADGAGPRQVGQAARDAFGALRVQLRQHPRHRLGPARRLPRPHHSQHLERPLRGALARDGGDCGQPLVRQDPAHLVQVGEPVGALRALLLRRHHLEPLALAGHRRHGGQGGQAAAADYGGAPPQRRHGPAPPHLRDPRVHGEGDRGGAARGGGHDPHLPHLGPALRGLWRPRHQEVEVRPRRLRPDGLPVCLRPHPRPHRPHLRVRVDAELLPRPHRGHPLRARPRGRHGQGAARRPSGGACG
mmetsp:Transcript_29276/g.76858  ORF Transcript_29276/g.76858 Transcript_29276/m.76858 type:complete len:380 (-) Transcript_29276:434-1573(-)